MITPSAVDVIDVISTSIEQSVKPDLVSMDAKSVVATIGHLLRHVRQRLLLEGQILTDDIAAQRRLLPAMGAWLAKEAPSAPCIAEIEEVLTRRYRQEGDYPDLTSLGAEAGALRRALTNALEQLVAMRKTHGHDADYRQLRTRVRDYVAQQIRSEAPLINPAYEGKGPRR